MDIDFQGIGVIMAGISFGGIGVIMAGSFLFAEQAEQYKRQIPAVLVGLILIMVSSVLVAAFGG